MGQKGRPEAIRHFLNFSFLLFKQKERKQGLKSPLKYSDFILVKEVLLIKKISSSSRNDNAQATTSFINKKSK
ncbi:MAG: hypothetical protein EOP42_29475 [Sphingobacteriaceae bacterium]|nr:MAG: hypothetical protein EOP42_29475 [Sphingobacteriaceae bacterium]